MPFGEVRDITGSQDPITQTDFGYTGQRNLASMGLMDYRARFYSPLLGRFTQPDVFVSNVINPQAWNRYSYVYNSPIVYNDPSGHLMVCNASGTICTDSPDDLPGPASSTSSNRGSKNPGNIDDDLGGDLHEDIFKDFQGYDEGNGEIEDSEGSSGDNGESTCYGAAVAGGLGILALIPMDIALVVANVEVTAIPVVGPFVEVIILLPVDLAVIDLHLSFAGLVVQGVSKPCDEVEFDFLPPWGIE